VRSVRVGDVAEQIRGVTFGRADAVPDPREGYVAILTAGNIRDGRLITSDLTYVPAERLSTKQFVRRNDVVVCTSSGSLRVVGKAAQSDGRFAGGFGAFLKVLRPGPEVDPRYFAHYFRTQSYRRTVRALAAGANINNLKNSHLDNLDLPLPSLAEQRRIAAILDHADTLRAKRRQVLAQLDALSQSIFRDMFGDPDQAAENVTFGEVTRLSGGRNLVAKDSNAASEYRVLKISAVTTGHFRPGESKPLPQGYVPPAAHLVRAGDLLMSRANTTQLVGAVAYVTSAPANLALPDKVWRLEWKVDAEPIFWHALLSNPAIRRRISRLSSGTGGSMKNVSKSKLETMSVPRIGLERQQEFASRAAQVDQREAEVAHARQLDDELFVSLQARAFAGEL
jgi:type I restriction enzyme S subunit